MAAIVLLGRLRALGSAPNADTVGLEDDDASLGQVRSTSAGVIGS
jgi:hypothetical protein